MKHSSSIRNADPVFFQSSTKEDWGFGLNEHKRAGFSHPLPLTWIKPVEGMTRIVKAIVCCPSCRVPRLLDERVHSILPNNQIVASDGPIKSDFHCPCGFNRRCFLDRWLNKPLYACAIEWILPELDAHGRNKIRKDIVYTSADSEAEAKFHCGPGNYRFVSVGLAIAFFTKDAEGKQDGALVGDSRGFMPALPKAPKVFVGGNS